ncbi:hypothetical protein D3C87_1345470 [compost metagenome]
MSDANFNNEEEARVNKARAAHPELYPKSQSECDRLRYLALHGRELIVSEDCPERERLPEE